MKTKFGTKVFPRAKTTGGRVSGNFSSFGTEIRGTEKRDREDKWG